MYRLRFALGCAGASSLFRFALLPESLEGLLASPALALSAGIVDVELMFNSARAPVPPQQVRR
jgi:hypothetical protein